MIETGRLVIKTCGRDSGKVGVIIEQIDDTYVLVDGQLRRRKCNRLHLEPLNKRIDIKAGATSETVIKELEKLGIKVKKTKPKKALERVGKKKSPSEKKAVKKKSKK